MKRTFTTLLLLLCITMANAQGIINHPATGKTTTQKKQGTTPAKKDKSGTTSSARRSIPRPTLGTSNYTPNVRTFRVGDVEFEMVEVRGGTFMMGATSDQTSYAFPDEKPVHQVTLSGYYIGRTEVTQELWQAVMGSNPSLRKGDKRPVEQVSWNDCQTFISKLNSLTGKRFRLPTEAEWEFAARGGVKSRGYMYSGSNTPGSVAWYTENVDYETIDVGSKLPNELGLYDMSGNVWEWCSDRMGSYSKSAQTNPKGSQVGSGRVFRGGCFANIARGCRVSNRFSTGPDLRRIDVGLRLCLSK